MNDGSQRTDDILLNYGIPGLRRSVATYAFDGQVEWFHALNLIGSSAPTRWIDRRDVGASPPLEQDDGCRDERSTEECARAQLLAKHDAPE